MQFDEFVLVGAVSELPSEVPASADAIEFRMDMAEHPLAQLDGFEHTAPIIATNRAAEEGGQDPGPNRLELLLEAISHPAVEAIDLELSTVQSGEADEHLEAARETDTAVIVSWHDFAGTPSADRLRARLRAAADVGTVGKAAVTAESVGDVLVLLEITHELTRAGATIATMSMGEIGRHSRAVAPLYGSRIGYAPLDPAESTAPGQYDLETLADLVARLRSQP